MTAPSGSKRTDPYTRDNCPNRDFNAGQLDDFARSKGVEIAVAFCVFATKDNTGLDVDGLHFDTFSIVKPKVATVKTRRVIESIMSSLTHWLSENMEGTVI